MERENLNIENVEIFVNKKVSFERSKIQKDILESVILCTV